MRWLRGKASFPPDAPWRGRTGKGKRQSTGTVMIGVVAKLNHVGEGPLPDSGGNGFGLAPVPQGVGRSGWWRSPCCQWPRRAGCPVG